jgi:uncharacterized UPF0160 family protein
MGEELQELSQISDLVFVHHKGFIGGATSLEG